MKSAEKDGSDKGVSGVVTLDLILSKNKGLKWRWEMERGVLE